MWQGLNYFFEISYVCSSLTAIEFPIWLVGYKRVYLYITIFYYFFVFVVRIRRISFALQLYSIGQLKIENNVFWIRFNGNQLHCSCIFHKTISFIKRYSFYELYNNSKLCIILYFYLFFSFIYIHTTLIELCEYIHCNQYRFFFFQLSVYTYFTFANKNV